MPASLAGCLFLAGVLLVYVEFLRPGTVLAGIAGLVLCAYGAWGIWLNRPHLAGVVLCAAALPIYVCAVFARPRFFLAGVASLVLLVGAAQLFVPADIAIIVAAILFAVVTTFLIDGAARARRNKTADLG